MLCQILAIIILILNFVMTNLFLDGGTFYRYGYDVINYTFSKNETMDEEAKNTPEQYDPMCVTFPTRVSCTMKIGGTGSGTNWVNGLCILSQNIINEKIYLFLWFWFMLLFILAAINMVLHICVIAVPKCRQLIITKKISDWGHGTRDLDYYINNCTIGDWFVLLQISKNNHKEYFVKFLQELARPSENAGENDRLLEDGQVGIQMNNINETN